MGASAPVVVVARWQVRPNALGEVLAHVSELRDASLAEPGCLGYEVFQAIGSSDTVLLLEHYRNDTALEVHRQSAHYRTLVVDRILPLLSARVVDVLRPRGAALPAPAPCASPC